MEHSFGCTVALFSFGERAYEDQVRRYIGVGVAPPKSNMGVNPDGTGCAGKDKCVRPPFVVTPTCQVGPKIP